MLYVSSTKFIKPNLHEVTISRDGEIYDRFHQPRRWTLFASDKKYKYNLMKIKLSMYNLYETVAIPYHLTLLRILLKIQKDFESCIRVEIDKKTRSYCEIRLIFIRDKLGELIKEFESFKTDIDIDDVGGMKEELDKFFENEFINDKRQGSEFKIIPEIEFIKPYHDGNTYEFPGTDYFVSIFDIANDGICISFTALLYNVDRKFFKVVYGLRDYLDEKLGIRGKIKCLEGIPGHTWHDGNFMDGHEFPFKFTYKKIDVNKANEEFHKYMQESHFKYVDYKTVSENK